MILEVISAFKYRLKEEPEVFHLPFKTGVYYDCQYYSLADDVLTAKVSFSYDGPSGPTVDTKDTLKGSMAHDILCQMIDEKTLDNSFKPLADAYLESMCISEAKRLYAKDNGIKRWVLKAISKPRFKAWEFCVNKFGGIWSRTHKPNKIIEV